jgi:hypothetical protein
MSVRPATTPIAGSLVGPNQGFETWLDTEVEKLNIGIKKIDL